MNMVDVYRIFRGAFYYHRRLENEVIIMEFKKGDIVRCVSIKHSYGTNPIKNKTYEVKKRRNESYNDDMFLTTIGMFFYDDDFELVNPNWRLILQ